MIALVKKPPTTLFVFVIFSFILLWTSSCEESDSAKPPSRRAVNSLPDTLTPNSAQTLYNQFLHVDEDLDHLDKGFLYKDGTRVKKIKVYQLTNQQCNIFFERLKRIKENTSQNPSIKIDLAAISQTLTDSIYDSPNVLPLIKPVLPVDTKGSVKEDQLGVYPLRSTHISLSTQLKMIDYSNDPIPIDSFGYRRIPVDTARKMFKQWKDLNNRQISNQLYPNKKVENQCSTDPDGRVCYYVFDATDTEAIYSICDSLHNAGAPIYFYLHLGLDYNTNADNPVPLRTILHIDTRDFTKDDWEDQPALNSAPAYFEFSKPCPNYCPDTY